MNWVMYDELAEITREQWDYMAKQLGCQVCYTGVSMERKEYPVTHYVTGVYVGGKYLTRDEVARAQLALTEMDVLADKARAEERKKQEEEQKKKDEEAKRQANVRLCAERHMTKRHTWLLLDPQKVREALTYADKYGNMVSLDEDGSVGHDPADIRLVDQSAGTYNFYPKVRR